jgi:hypothetical protein
MNSLQLYMCVYIRNFVVCSIKQFLQIATFVKRDFFSYNQTSLCVFVLLYMVMALAWAETCSVIHVHVRICDKACVVLEGKTGPYAITDTTG